MERSLAKTGKDVIVTASCVFSQESRLGCIPKLVRGMCSLNRGGTSK